MGKVEETWYMEKIRAERASQVNAEESEWSEQSDIGDIGEGGIIIQKPTDLIRESVRNPSILGNLIVREVAYIHAIGILAKQWEKGRISPQLREQKIKDFMSKKDNPFTVLTTIEAAYEVITPTEQRNGEVERFREMIGYYESEETSCVVPHLVGSTPPIDHMQERFIRIKQDYGLLSNSDANS